MSGSARSRAVYDGKGELDRLAWPGAAVRLMRWAQPHEERVLESAGWTIDEETRSPWGSVLAVKLDFAQTLRLRRIAAGMTRRDLARESGYSMTSVAAIEGAVKPGSRKARRDLLDACARATKRNEGRAA